MTITNELCRRLSLAVYSYENDNIGVNLAFPRIIISKINQELPSDKNGFYNSLSGCAAAFYYNEDINEGVIAYRGTEMGTGFIVDSSNDLAIIDGRTPSQYQDAVNFYNAVTEAYPDTNIVITGHSLGGCLTQLVCAYALYEKQKRHRGYTFNAAGVSKTAVNNNFAPNANYDIVNYSVMNDWWGMIGMHLGSLLVFPPVEIGTKYLAPYKDTHNWIINKKVDFKNAMPKPAGFNESEALSLWYYDKNVRTAPISNSFAGIVSAIKNARSIQSLENAIGIIQNTKGCLTYDMHFKVNDAEYIVLKEDGTVLNGNEANNVIFGNKLSNTITSLGGDDIIYGGQSGSRLYGGSGNDCIYGSDGDDVLDGGSGNDSLFGGSGNDKMFGGFGIDFYFVGRYKGRKIISDVDKAGYIIYDGIILKRADRMTNTPYAYKVWRDFNDNLYHYEGRDLIINDNVIIKNFKNETLNITLYKEDGTVEPPYPEDGSGSGSGGEGGSGSGSGSGDGEKDEDEKGNIGEDEENPDSDKILQEIPVLRFGPDNLFTELDKRFDLADRENRRPVDPLIFDLDYDGKIELTDVEGGRYFDIDNDGLAQKVAWIKEGSALLVLDKNGNGTIDNGLELFGDNTLLSDGKYAASGMEALAELDTNKDGKITSFDSKFNELKLLLADDTTVSLTEAGIKEIRLGYRNVDISDAGGNRQVKRAVFVTNDNVEHMYGEFMLNQNKYDSVSADILEVPDGISKLPNVGGFGLVHSLHQAMVRDESKDLAALVQSFTDEEDIKVKHQIAEHIVYKWAGVENVSSEGRGLFDGKKLAVIEKFAGRFFCNNAKSTVINNNAVKTLNDIFTRIVGYFYSSAAIQTHMSDLFSKIVFEYRNDKWSVNLDKTFETIKKIIGDDESQSKDYSLNMVSDFGYVLKFFNYTDGINLSEYTRNFEYRFKSDYTASFLKYLIGWVGTVNKDTMDGNNDANFMYGREGDDTIKGYGGNDTIFGGEGNDHIYGDGGVDILDGGEGDDWIEGGMDNDTYCISSGKDYLYDTQGDDTYIIDPSILKAPSTSTINEMRGIDKLIFVNVKSDEINVKSNSSGQIFFSFKNYPGIEIKIISQLNSDRRIDTYEFSDKTMNFSEIVNTFLCYQDGTDSDDNYTIPVFARQTHGLKGNDTINGDNNANILYGDEGDDTIKGYGGNDTIFGGEGNDHIYGDDGNDTIYGGEGKDWINGGNGDDVMDGGEGDDTVQSSYGNNTFYLSPGNDKIQSGGHNSNDTYIFDINRMTEASNNQINDFGGEDKLVFAGINSDEIKVKRNTNGWFSITFNNYPEHSITLVLQSNSTHKIESFVFDDKTMTFDEILQICS